MNKMPILATLSIAFSFLQCHQGNESESLRFSQKEKEFLYANATGLNVADDGDFSTFSRLDPLLDHNDVLFTGEHHATHISQEVCLKILKYVHQSKGIRHYLAEMGYGLTYMINQFLETGQMRYLDEIMAALKGTAAYTQQYAAFIQKVRDLNQTLSQDARIVFVGIDVEHQIDIAFRALDLLIPQPSTGEPSYFNDIRSWANIFQDARFNRTAYPGDWYAASETIITALVADLKDNPDRYGVLLAENYFDFKLIADNCAAAFRYYKTNDSNLREEAIYSNFLEIYQHLPGDAPKKFYGQWGSWHIIQVSHVPGFFVSDPLASRLDNDEKSPVRGKIISILPVYSSCEYLVQKNDRQQAANITDITKGGLSALKPSTSDTVLFPLRGQLSPFESTCNDFFCRDDTLRVTTDFVQFLLLIENSAANTIWAD